MQFDHEDYLKSDSIKCGEILLSLRIADKDEYMLKCCDCDSVYTKLENFILHWSSHYYTLYKEDVESEEEIEPDKNVNLGSDEDDSIKKEEIIIADMGESMVRTLNCLSVNGL